MCLPTLFESPKPPELPTVEPKRTDPAVQAAANEERARRLRALGRNQTILTGLGTFGSAPVRRKTLLGE